MDCNVVTGYMAGGSSACPPRAGRIVPPAGRLPLFTPDTPPGTLYSRPITLVAGDIILIDGYNMPDIQKIFLNRIVIASPEMAMGNNCDPCALDAVYGPGGKIVYRNRMLLGGRYWTLSKTIPQLMVAIPGSYELELETVDMLGNMDVGYTTWPAAKTPDLPDKYFATVGVA